MKHTKRIFSILLTLCLLLGTICTSAFATTFTDAHGNVIELDDTLEAYATVDLSGADNAARRGETNLGDLWTDALRWFVTSGKINEYFDEDDVTAGNNSVAVGADNVVALWNGGTLRMIQLYEQKQNDISKAQVMVVVNLAKVLGCEIEDLIE